MLEPDGYGAGVGQDHPDSQAWSKYIMGTAIESSLSLLAPPYEIILPVPPEDAIPNNPKILWGAALIWAIGTGREREILPVVAGRPGGVPLMIILPEASRIQENLDLLLEANEVARPTAVLPHHPAPDPEELAGLLRDEPKDLSGELVDYLRWRGLSMSQELRHTVRQVCDLAEHTTTLAGLCRSMYISRRALGRRFRKASLPVPSHWLQFCRLLRASLRLQNSTGTLFDIARRFNYADGFTLSNQMFRLLGTRPSMVRDHFGWEWLVESWLIREAEYGNVDLPSRRK